MRVEVEHEEDGRWIGEVPALPGVLAYGATAEEARAKATALALRVIADRLENGESVSRVEGIASHRLEHQAPDRIA
jgi:predicted RNase H-like HicB family nuclease